MSDPDPQMPGTHTGLGIKNKDTIAMAHEVAQAARAAGYQLYFVFANGNAGDHLNGIAVDYSVYDDGTIQHPGPERPAVGNWVSNYVWENRLRLGVRYVIWNRRIISRTGIPANVWVPYHGTPDPHTNHVHVSRFSDARPYTPPPKPPVAAKPVDRWLSLLLEARAKDMTAPRNVVTHAATTNTLEKALKTWGFPGGLVVDGHYGTSTDLAVKWFQGRVSPGEIPDGIIGEKEWSTLSVAPNGQKLFTPQLGNYKRWIPAPKSLWLSLFLESRKTDLGKAQSVQTHGFTVIAVKRALRTHGYPSAIPDNGHYDTATDAAVKWFQKSLKAKETGILTEGQWQKLAAGPNGSNPLFTPELGNYKVWL